MRPVDNGKVVVGLLVTVAGMSGLFVLRGSNSSGALIAVGLGVAAWGVVKPQLDARAASKFSEQDAAKAMENLEARLARGPIQHKHGKGGEPTPVGVESLMAHLTAEHGEAPQAQQAIAFLEATRQEQNARASLSWMHSQSHAKTSGVAGTRSRKRYWGLTVWQWIVAAVGAYILVVSIIALLGSN